MTAPNPERLRELLAKATQGEWLNDSSANVFVYDQDEDIRDAHAIVIVAQCGEDEQAQHDSALIVAAVNALPALLQQLEEAQLKASQLHDARMLSITMLEAAEAEFAERDAEVALLRARETDLQNALYRWLPHITPFSPEIQGDDCNLLIGLMEPVGPELGESIRQRAIAAERVRKDCVKLAEKWERISSTHGVRCFTGDDHLIFANELRVALGQQPAAFLAASGQSAGVEEQ